MEPVNHGTMETGNKGTRKPWKQGTRELWKAAKPLLRPHGWTLTQQAGGLWGSDPAFLARFPRSLEEPERNASRESGSGAMSFKDTVK